MDMINLINKIKSEPKCKILPSMGLPTIATKHVLPFDLTEFYRLCGGIVFFEDSPFSVRIVSPEEFVLANPVIIDKEIIEAEIKKGTYDKEISNDWYIIGDLNDSNYIVIDLNQCREGRCYSAFWDRYPSRGSTPIIAYTFTELLEKLLKNKGKYFYFEQEDFVNIGDAYDTI